MIRYIRNYPLSLVVVAIVVYLSFFRPPKTDLDEIRYIDKVVHVCMYFGVSGVLWAEFWRTHRRQAAPLWHAWVGACLLPIAFSGAIELMQAYLTVHRSGDWLDFAANTVGVILASLVGYGVLRHMASRPHNAS